MPGRRSERGSARGRERACRALRWAGGAAVAAVCLASLWRAAALGLTPARLGRHALLTAATAALVLALRRLLQKHLPPRWMLLLWLVVLLQAAGVTIPQPGVGLQTLVPAATVQQQAAPLPQQAAPAPAESAQAAPTPAAPAAGGGLTVTRLSRLALGLWLGGTVLLLGWFAGQYARFAAQVRRCPVIADPETLTLLAECQEAVGWHGRVTLRRGGQSPLLLGYGRPTILLPDGFSAGEQRQILLHELCHARHGDNAISLAAVLVACSQWFDPLLWLCLRAVKQDGERTCDAAVVAITGDRSAYASLLLKTISARQSR